MITGVSHFAQEDLPRVEYLGISREQARFAIEAAANLEGYEVSLMPIDTPEEALKTAREWAADLQAQRDAKARERGAIMTFSTHEELTPEEFAVQAHRERGIRLLMRIRLPREASLYELFRSYYEPEIGPEPNQDQ